LTISRIHDKIRYNLKRGSEINEKSAKKKLKKMLDKLKEIVYNNKCKEQIINLRKR
jgi:hypothetical protein